MKNSFFKSTVRIMVSVGGSYLGARLGGKAANWLMDKFLTNR